jgi:hypothetical protein
MSAENRKKKQQDKASTEPLHPDALKKKKLILEAVKGQADRESLAEEEISVTRTRMGGAGSFFWGRPLGIVRADMDDTDPANIGDLDGRDRLGQIDFDDKDPIITPDPIGPGTLEDI